MGGRIGRGPALDLANTVVAGPAGEADLLDSPGRLGAWLRGEAPWLGDAPPEVALRLADFRSLRGAIRVLLSSTVAGGRLPEEAVRAANAASAAVPRSPALDTADPRRPVVVDAVAGGSRTSEILASIARSAIEVVGGPERARLRVCAEPACGAFFLARARQVWCSDACGNRARVARHRRSVRST
jgi:predicted RNA-binding Zn ribbon-like protein